MTASMDERYDFDTIGSQSERAAAYDLIHGAPSSSYHDLAMCYYHPCAKCKAHQVEREREMEEEAIGYTMLDDGIRERLRERREYR